MFDGPQFAPPKNGGAESEIGPHRAYRRRRIERSEAARPIQMIHGLHPSGCEARQSRAVGQVEDSKCDSDARGGVATTEATECLSDLWPSVWEITSKIASERQPSVRKETGWRLGTPSQSAESFRSWKGEGSKLGDRIGSVFNRARSSGGDDLNGNEIRPTRLHLDSPAVSRVALSSPRKLSNRKSTSKAIAWGRSEIRRSVPPGRTGCVRIIVRSRFRTSFADLYSRHRALSLRRRELGFGYERRPSRRGSSRSRD